MPIWSRSSGRERQKTTDTMLRSSRKRCSNPWMRSGSPPVATHRPGRPRHDALQTRYLRRTGCRHHDRLIDLCAQRLPRPAGTPADDHRGSPFHRPACGAHPVRLSAGRGVAGGGLRAHRRGAVSAQRPGALDLPLCRLRACAGVDGAGTSSDPHHRCGGFSRRHRTRCVIASGAVLVLVGNYLPKDRYNLVIGIRTPWTLADERVWDRTHRVIGVGLLTAGIIAMLGGWLIWNQILAVASLLILFV